MMGTVASGENRGFGWYAPKEKGEHSGRRIFRWIVKMTHDSLFYSKICQIMFFNLEKKKRKFPCWKLEKFNEKLVPFLESVELFKWSDYEKLPDSPVGGGARIIAGSDGKVVSRKKALPIFMPWFEREFSA